MKKIIVLLLCVFVFSNLYAQEDEGITKGDNEITFNGFIYSSVGTDSKNAFGNLFLSYGKYYTDKLLIGIAPGISISTATTMDGTEVNTDWSGQVFANYNFSVVKKAFPYVKGSYYQQTFDIPDGASFKDYGSIQIGLGYKSFFNEFASLDMSLNYGKSLAEGAEGGSLMFMIGLSFIF